MKKTTVLLFALGILGLCLAAAGPLLSAPAEKGEIDAPKTADGDGAEPAETKPAKPTWKVKFTALTGSLPKGVVLNPSETEAWVTNFGHDRYKNIGIFDANTGKFKEHINMRGRAVELAFSPDGKYAYVSNFDTGKLVRIDANSREIVDSAYSGRNPKIVTLSPDGKRIYVSNWTSRTVTCLDADSLSVLGEAAVGRAPRGSAADASGKKLFVANFESHTLSVVDTEKMKQTNTIEMGRHPRHVNLTPDGKTILVSNMGKGSDSIALVDPDKEVATKWIKVRRGPKAMAVSPDSRYLFTADYFGHSVSIVDIEKGEMIGHTAEAGTSPCGMDITDDGKTLYITAWKSNQLWAFDIAYPGEEKSPAPEGTNANDAAENGRGDTE